MTKKRLSVHKFASCDGCQLSLLDCEDELLALAGAIDIAYFPEASSDMQPGPYDVSLVEGSITTSHDLKRLLKIREESKTLITIGACATAGGIQALRNFRDVDQLIDAVYAHPEYIDSLATSTAIADHVNVDYELHGCPINKHQLIEVLLAYLNERVPQIRRHSVCHECKAKNNTCLLVVDKKPCLGPITQSGCNAICPSYDRACFGCYGPKENANPQALSKMFEDFGYSYKQIKDLYRSYNANAPDFYKESRRIEQKENEKMS